MHVDSLELIMETLLKLQNYLSFVKLTTLFVNNPILMTWMNKLTKFPLLFIIQYNTPGKYSSNWETKWWQIWPTLPSLPPRHFSKRKVIAKSSSTLERFSFLVLNQGPDHFIIVSRLEKFNETEETRESTSSLLISSSSTGFAINREPILVGTREQRILKSEIRTWCRGGIRVIYETKGKMSHRCLIRETSLILRRD